MSNLYRDMIDLASVLKGVMGSRTQQRPERVNDKMNLKNGAFNDPKI